MKIAIVVSSPMTIEVFLRDQVRRLSDEYEVTLIANLSQGASLEGFGDGVTLTNVAIERRIMPWRDLKAFLMLWRLFRKEKFKLVHSITPKAGLLAMSAAFFAGRPQSHTHVYRAGMGNQARCHAQISAGDGPADLPLLYLVLC